MRPEFLHQFIEDEMIRGYEDPQLHFYFARTSLDCYFHYTFKSKSPDAVNLETYFAEVFGEFLLLDRKLFEQKLLEQQAFEIPAKVFETTVRGDKEYQAYLVEDITKKDFARFNFKMQIFLKFFIETSSFIEADDAMWKVAFLVEKVRTAHQADTRTFVGYLSYYPFYRRLDQYRVRISQQLILPVFQRKGLGSYLLSVPASDQKIYQKHQADPNCYEFTVEEQSDGFQLMRDSLDLKMLLERNAFDFLAQKDQPLLREPKAIYDTSRKLNKELLEKIHKDTKLSKAQISRVFDLALYCSIDRSDKSAEVAFEGFLKKKLERLNSQLLFSKVREKYIEFEGQVLPVSYSLFAPKVSENSNQFDKILAFTMQQYRAVLLSHYK